MIAVHLGNRLFFLLVITTDIIGHSKFLQYIANHFLIPEISLWLKAESGVRPLTSDAVDAYVGSSATVSQ